MKIKWLLALAIWMIVGAACRETPVIEPSPTATPVPTVAPGTLYVDAAAELGPINPYVYGTNYGPWIALPLGVMEAYQTSGLTFIRYPGGEWGDRNEIKDYQLDQFMDLAGMIGAEPSISVNLLNGTPAQAADLVRLANIEKGYGIKYWSIGNEPALYARNPGKEEFTTEYYNEQWRRFAQAMRAIDPDILLIGPEVTGFTAVTADNPKDEHGHDWMRQFLLANGDMVDVVTIHRYPFPTSVTEPTASIEQLRQNSREWDDLIPALRSLIRETTGRDIPIGVTEINSHWNHAVGGEATPDSVYNAIWWADVLGRLIQQKVDIVAQFVLQHSTNGYGLLARNEARPTYYVYRMYQHFGDELLYASSDDPDVSIYAARRHDGALTLMMVNLGPDEKTKPLRLDNAGKIETAEIWRFDSDHQAELIDTQAISNGAEISLPAQSITLYILSFVR